MTGLVGRLVWGLLSLGACAADLTITASVREGGIAVTTNHKVDRIEVFDEAGQFVGAAPMATRASTVTIPFAPRSEERWQVRTAVGKRSAMAWVSGPSLPVRLAFEAPIGLLPAPVSDGEVLSVWTSPGAVGGLSLWSDQAVSATVAIDGTEVSVSLSAHGVRQIVPISLEQQRTVRVRVGAESITFRVVPRTASADLSTLLKLDNLRFPTDAFGQTDPAIPSDRLRLPTWSVLRLWGRVDGAATHNAPIGWQSVDIVNDSDAAIDLVVRASVVDGSNHPVAAFRSKLRELDELPFVSVLVRVPASSRITAVMPVYLDPGGVVAPLTVTRRVEAWMLGGSAPLVVQQAPLFVVRPAPLGMIGFAAALGFAGLGFFGLLLGGGRFFRDSSVVELVTIAMFAAVVFTVGAAFQLVGMAIAMVLGPFAPFVSGLFDDAFRAVLFGTLLLWMPRPGVYACASVVGFLMRALVFGSLHPVDLLYVGSSVALHEAALYVAGVTRGTAWQEAGAVSQGLRLFAAFGPANALSVLLGLATAAVLYRLYFAAWYVGALALIPGFLYVAVGCALAVPVARRLREVAA